MYGIYINCKNTPFIDLIIKGLKPYETRTRNVLASLVGKRVALIETGKGCPTIRAMATIESARTVSYGDVVARTAACIIGTPYDVVPGKSKVFYKLANVTPVTPYKLPDNRINHGRSYTEWKDWN